MWPFCEESVCPDPVWKPVIILRLRVVDLEAQLLHPSDGARKLRRRGRPWRRALAGINNIISTINM